MGLRQSKVLFVGQYLAMLRPVYHTRTNPSKFNTSQVRFYPWSKQVLAAGFVPIDVNMLVQRYSNKNIPCSDPFTALEISTCLGLPSSNRYVGSTPTIQKR
jgi:hypothetical protein